MMVRRELTIYHHPLLREPSQPQQRRRMVQGREQMDFQTTMKTRAGSREQVGPQDLVPEIQGRKPKVFWTTKPGWRENWKINSMGVQTFLSYILKLSLMPRRLVSQYSCHSI